MTDELKSKPCFPLDRADDLVLFGMLFLMIVVMSWFGHWDLVGNLASGFLGAVTMYIKGQGGKIP